MIDQLGIEPLWQRAQLNKPPSLARDEIHLWCLPLTLTNAQTQQAVDWLSDIQRDKYARRNSEQLKAAYLAGRYYLFTLLGAYTNTPADQVLLSYTRLNKPYLTDTNADIHFNFTDTKVGEQHVGALTFCRERQVGVDIEALSRRSDFSKIIDRRFSKAEIEFATNVDGSIDSERFLSIWTRKEASGKATGQGINFAMNQRDLASGDRYELSYFDEFDQAWRLLQIRFNQHCIGCVVHEGHQALTLKAFNSLEV